MGLFHSVEGVGTVLIWSFRTWGDPYNGMGNRTRKRYANGIVLNIFACMFACMERFKVGALHSNKT